MENSTIETKLGIQILERCSEQGCFSQVYFARDEQTLADVVVKVIEKSSLGDAYFDEARKIYESTHQNVVEIKCASDTDGHVFLMMERYEGSIASMMKTRHLTVRESIKYALDVLSGLHHIHTKRLVHFDIKPSNILLSKSNKALITDFGLSKYIDNSGFSNAPDNGLYTFHWPPEYLSSNVLTSMSDIYQVGVTLYRMLNGEIIWKENLNKFATTLEDFKNNIKTGKFPNRNFYLPHIPIAIKKIVNKAMHIDPDKRYQSALDFQNALSIDCENIDWLYSETNTTKRWERTVGDCLEVFQITQNDVGCESSRYKINKNTGKKRNIKTGCKKLISDVDAFCRRSLANNE